MSRVQVLRIYRACSIGLIGLAGLLGFLWLIGLGSREPTADNLHLSDVANGIATKTRQQQQVNFTLSSTTKLTLPKAKSTHLLKDITPNRERIRIPVLHDTR